MKVLLINGSPNEHGCTYTALNEAATALEKLGVETEIAWIGHKPIRGCQACKQCTNGRCIFTDDIVNEMLTKAEKADGYIIGSPVYFAGMNGSLKCLLDRMFYAGSRLMSGKPAAGVASARRAGTTLTIDQINKYFQISMMPVVSSNYWPNIHGNVAEEAAQDKEGLQIMRILARNMADMLTLIEHGRADGIAPIELEQKERFNYIR